MRVTAKGVLKYVLVTLLTALLLYLAFKGVNWSEFFNDIKGCNYWWVLASVVMGVLATVSRGYRWRVMMLPISPQLKRIECYDAYAICYIANLAFPRVGEFVRCGILADTKKVTFEQAFGNMMVERTWDIIVTGLMAVIIVAFTRFGGFIVEKMWQPMKEGMPALWIILVVILLFVFVGFFALVFMKEETLNKYKLGRKLSKFIGGLKAGIKSTFKMSAKQQISFYFHTLFIQLCYWLQVLFTFYAFEPFNSLTGMDAMFIYVVGCMAWMVPVQGGFGAYHGLLTLALVSIYGIEYNTSLAFATISHESQILQMIICGIISLIHVAIVKSRRAKTIEE
ncbi:MAG: flippase-like domain-containing protein [Bacteroidales bacterium]|nr:flippase-like domain-containing protein [Bacteroidales bacterium]